MREACPGRCVTYGIERDDVDYTIQDIKVGAKGTSFTLHSKGSTIPIHTPLLGRFNAVNAAAAVAAGLESGIDEKSVVAAFGRVPCVRGRMEGFDSGRGFHVIIDYAHTPDALQHALTAVRELTAGRLILVFGCGGDRDRGKRPVMGKVAATLADAVFVTSDNPRGEKPDTIIQDILDGLDSQERVRVVVDRKEAIEAALKEAGKGDAVLIAGKGHETYQEVRGERTAFDDRATAESVLDLR